MKALRPLFFFLLLPAPAFAFPEMVRHGYQNCVTCHASPTGGGLLTEYGRAISKELLSRGAFFFEKKMDLKVPVENQEEQPLAGSLDLPKGVSLGGDVRALQLIVDNPKQTSGRFILMQADLEAAYSDGKRFVVDGTIGRAEPDGKARYVNDWLVSRHHWALVKMGPPEAADRYNMRFGRFYPAYGLNIPEHTAATRSGIGFDQQQETYNAELSYVGEEWSVFATYLLGRPDNPGKSRETGGALQVSRSLGSTYRVGGNVLYGRDITRASRAIRRMAGLFGQLGFSPQWYSLVDFSVTHDDVSNAGAVELARLGWEFSQGVHLVATQEVKRPSFRQSEVFTENYSVGLKYFPRAHWEFSFTAGKERSSTVSRDFDNYFWALAHYYL